MPLLTPDEVAGHVHDGMTIGVGGWGSRRKPMTLLKALVRSGARDLTLVTFGGPDVGILARLGRLRRLITGFVSLDSIPLEPHYRRVREAGLLPDVVDLDEGMVVQGLRAAAWNLPFLPIRISPRAAAARHPMLRTVRSPYADAEELLAMPALRLDVTLVHANRADKDGNAQLLGPDPYFDEWFCLAAKRAFVSADHLGVDAQRLDRCLLNPTMVAGVCHAPGGAGFTESLPDHPRDEVAQATYAAAREDPAFEAWVSAWLNGGLEAPC